MRRFAINIGLLLFSLLFVMGCLEIFLRVARIQPMTIPRVYLHQPSTIEGLVYELRKKVDTSGFRWEHITTNSEGFRSPERDPKKPVIAFIGDSYTFGYGVSDEETNPAYVQKEFPAYYVLNSGVNGYNIEQQALTYRHRIAPLHPSLVVVEFVFNDMDPKGFFDEEGIARVGVSNEALVKESITRQGLLNFPGKFWLEQHSALFNFIEHKTKWLPFRKHVVDPKDTITPDQLKIYERWFSALDDAVQTKQKLFVIWPESNWHTESRIFLKDLAEKRGYKVIDLYDTLGNGYASLGWDYHPKASVHQQVADVIIKAIKEHKMLP